MNDTLRAAEQLRRHAHLCGKRSRNQIAPHAPQASNPHAQKKGHSPRMPSSTQAFPLPRPSAPRAPAATSSFGPLQTWPSGTLQLGHLSFAQAAVYRPRLTFLNLFRCLMNVWFTIVRKFGLVVM